MPHGKNGGEVESGINNAVQATDAGRGNAEPPRNYASKYVGEQGQRKAHAKRPGKRIEDRQKHYDRSEEGSQQSQRQWNDVPAMGGKHRGDDGQSKIDPRDIRNLLLPANRRLSANEHKEAGEMV